MRIAVLCPADIAKRRFLPSLAERKEASFAGIGFHSRREEAAALADTFGGTLYETQEELFSDDTVDAVYIPSVPAAHFAPAKKALLSGKHVLMEKPFAVSYEETASLVSLAKERGLALHENFTFLYHTQLDEIRRLVADGTIGTLRLVRASFGFPGRPAGDFRYDASLGGGAFLDAGCYTLRLASVFLGADARVTDASIFYDEGSAPDVSGSGMLQDGAGLTAQVAFGMDNAYRCALELWGSSAYLTAPRIFTAPDTLSPVITLAYSDRTEERTLSACPSFAASIAHFISFTKDAALREAAYEEILSQAKRMGDFMSLADRS